MYGKVVIASGVNSICGNTGTSSPTSKLVFSLCHKYGTKANVVILLIIVVLNGLYIVSKIIELPGNLTKE